MRISRKICGILQGEIIPIGDNSYGKKKKTTKSKSESSKGGNFINRKTDGQLLTTDSMKTWSRKITKELGIHFKYHNLRHTHASFLAACNTFPNLNIAWDTLKWKQQPNTISGKTKSQPIK